MMLPVSDFTLTGDFDTSLENAVFKNSEGRHTLAFHTTDKISIDDLNKFTNWISDYDLCLRCPETHIEALGNHLYIEVSGILLKGGEPNH